MGGAGTFNQQLRTSNPRHHCGCQGMNRFNTHNHFGALMLLGL